MDVNFSKIQDSFRITSLNPVTRQGDGDFMEGLKDLFAAAQERMTPVEGLPEGVYTIASQPQTLEGLQITSVDVPPASI